jgi:hypothetical protein
MYFRLKLIHPRHDQDIDRRTAMRGIDVEAQSPIEVHYRRNFTDVWVSFRSVNTFRSRLDELQYTVLAFRAEGSSEVLDRWNARFWADAIVVRNYAASSDLSYYPRIDADCRVGTAGLEVSLTAYPNPLPDVPRELLGWTGAHPTHLSYTANRTRFARVLDLFFAIPSPLVGSPVKPSAEPDKTITLGRGAGLKPIGTPISMKKTDS